MAPKNSKAPPSVHRLPPSNDVAYIRAVCWDAKALVNGGRLTEALTLTGKLVERHSSSPLAHRAHATIDFFASCKTQGSDDTASQSYLTNSLASARLALALSPSSIELPLWYVKNFIPCLTNKEQSFRELIQMYGVAFSLEDPVDPIAEVLDERVARALETPQLRVEFSFAALWYAVLNVSRISKGEGPLPELNARQILGEVKGVVKWKERVLRYLSITHLKGFLSVSTSDLRAHLSSLPLETEEDRALLGKALEANSTFNFWTCSSCDEANTRMEFTDWESLGNHIVEQHVDLPSYLPIEAPKEWIEFITGDIWEPFDLTDNANGLHKSTDKHRIMLLGEVQEMLKMLVKNKKLAQSMVGYVVQVYRRPLDRFDPETNFICFLDVPNLERLLMEFHEFLKSFESCKYDDQDSSVSISNLSNLYLYVLLECHIFYPLTSELLLDDHPFLEEFGSENPGTAAPPGDGEALHAKPNASSLVSWLCDYKSIQDHLCIWRQTKEAKLCASGDILEKLKLKSNELNLLLQKKLRFLNQTKVFTNIINLLEEEEKKRKCGEEYVHQSYEAVLKQRQEELKRDLTPASEVIELELISEVLEKEKATKTSEPAHPDGHTHGNSSTMHELEADTRILVQTKKEMEHLCRELMMIDGGIMSTQMDIKHLKLKIKIASGFDYRNILLPLVKSFMKQQLGDLLDKDAEEKSNALLKELDDDARRSKGDDPPKQGKQKTKGKRRNQSPRKASDKKEMVSSEEMLIEEAAGESEFLAENASKNSESPSGGAYFETESECLDFSTLICLTII